MPVGSYRLTDMPTLSFKVSSLEVQAIRARAKEEGRTVSDYLRRRALPRRGRGKPIRLVRSRATGALVVVGPPGTPVLTSEAVKGMLATFDAGIPGAALIP